MLTREEALTKLDDCLLDDDESAFNYYRFHPTIDLVNAIYDSFEAQKCENCKYVNEYDRCLKGVIPTTTTINGITQEIFNTFSCNRWESKDGK